MEEMARKTAVHDRLVKGRRADWLTELVWKRTLQLMVLYPQDMLLDISCEDGELLRRIRKTNANVAGICATPQLARTARARVSEADIMYAEMDDFPWLNQCFDVVLCLLSVSAIREMEAMLSEVFRVLKPGGQFLFAAAWMPQPFRSLVNRFLVDDSQESVPLLSKATLLENVNKAGFTRASWVSVANLRCIVSCFKPEEKQS